MKQLFIAHSVMDAVLQVKSIYIHNINKKEYQNTETIFWQGACQKLETLLVDRTV